MTASGYREAGGSSGVTGTESPFLSLTTEAHMDAITEDTRLPTAIDALPVVRAAAAMRSKLRNYKHQVETEQRLPPKLVEEFRAAGFYSLVMPRSMGGLQADPLTYQRVV